MAVTKPKPKPKPIYYIASFSGGKDSTAMVLRLIELGYPLDEVICCDTTMEFPAMYRHIKKVKAVVEAAGIKFTTLRAEHDFEYYMLNVPVFTEKAIRKRQEKGLPLKGYSWPEHNKRWCTSSLKTNIIDAYLRELKKRYNVIQYIGIAADEGYRLHRKNNQDQNHRHPLVEWGWTEGDAMAYCRGKGYDWEGLYNLFNRVSCWCCPLQQLSELRTLRREFPDLWQELKRLDNATWRTFKNKGQSVEALGKRFDLEEALETAGEKITNRAFYTDLRRHLAGEVTVAEILRERQEKRAADIAAKQIPGQVSLFN